MNNPSPSPWTGDPEGTCAIVIEDAKGTPIAEAYLDERVPNHPGEANARLIAAAPDLFEALSNLYEVFTSRMNDVRDRDWTSKEIQAENETCKAINKALS